MTTRTIQTAGVAALALFAALLFLVLVHGRPTHAGLITGDSPASEGLYRSYEFFASSTAPSTIATTTTATSTNIASYADASGRIDRGFAVIAGAKKVTMIFQRGDLNGQGNTGSTAYKVQVTESANPTEADWKDYTRFISATSTTEQATVSIGAATSTVMFGLNLDNHGFYALRCIVVETTDGQHYCRAGITY